MAYLFVIGARLVQGGFGALLIPQDMGLLIRTLSREQFPSAASAFGPVLGGSAVLGPILAGLVISADVGGLTWRPLFLINIVLAGVGPTPAAGSEPSRPASSSSRRSPWSASRSPRCCPPPPATRTPRDPVACPPC